MKNIALLGCTGSIGDSSLQVVDSFNADFKLYFAVAHSNAKKLHSIIKKYKPKYAALTNESAFKELKDILGSDCSTKLLCTWSEVSEVLSHSQVDVVISAIVGSVGLKPTLSAIKSGKKILLANKESLVVAGSYFMDAAKKHNAQILPIDSEHNALFQCLPQEAKDNLGYADLRSLGVNKLVLTASGGPFFGYTREQLKTVSVRDACAHPKWKMGKKISVDSASLMNKGLEYIEAYYLFNAKKSDQLDVLIHPESIVHSIVEYQDKSMLAHLSATDMKVPIVYSLFYPERSSCSKAINPLSLAEAGSLSFFKPDLKTFSNLGLAINSVHSSKEHAVVLNAVNELHVSLFLEGKISFLDISVLNEKMVTKFDYSGHCNSIEDIIDLDLSVRDQVSSLDYQVIV